MTTAAAKPTTIKVAPNSAVEKVRVFQAAPKKAFDANFQLETETYEGAASFLIELQLKPDAPAGASEISAAVRYQTCNDKVCFPPHTETATATLTIDPAAHVAAPTIPAGYGEVTGAPKSSAAATQSAPDTQGLGAFLLVAFGFGLAAIFTPCVFPLIPITMSFFLNRQGTRREGVFHAALFCLGIVVLFSGLGLLTTAILGPFGVVQLGSNPWVNGFIALVFLAFGLSLLGAFEITIPSAVLTRLDKGTQKGGIAGTLLMGLTFALSSFACVGPFMGTLLAASVGGGGARPLMGMLAFASGLALPFFLLALFPSYLKRLPKSGGWLARVKVVMGFIVLAAMLKFLASVDQVLQWNLITRERFLAAWIVLFAMAGLYLLGFVRLEGIAKDAPMGLGRLLVGMLFLIFAISLAPGMSGAKLGELDAYIPVAAGGSGGGAGEAGLVWMKNQYREALDRARREGKLVFVNFTGYACTNCHWMKQNMFTRPEVAQQMRNLVLVDLYTDRDDAVSQQNQQLEQTAFHTIAIPFYVLYDPGPAGTEPRVVATFPGLTREAPQYVSFLNAASPTAAPVVNSLDLGVAFASTDLTGKVVVANFWATWCVPCRKEIPEFNKLQGALGARGVQVVGVSLDDDADVIKPFQSKNPMNYPVGLATDQTRKSYNLDQLPITVVFDRKGQIVDRFVGLTDPDTIRAAVEKAL
jgi:thiol:disulfide interchange protein DsbD